MPHTVQLQLAAILILGVGAQWLAWRLRLPSILLLLATGIVSGPVTRLVRPDALFGDLLLPLVSLSVAVILYEGGLNLRLRELRQIGTVLLLLTTVGAAISGATGVLAARYLLEMPWPVAALLGSILVVTGPTVIGPLLRHLRLRGKVGALLKWEGIVIDPMGATLAVLVFTLVQAGALHEGISEAMLAFGITLVVGITFGCLAAGVLVSALARFWVPDYLHNAFSLALMALAFVAANWIQEEAGLLVVTVMGIALANQRWVAFRHVIEFKETLTVLLISCLFIILSARLDAQDLRNLGWRSVLFVIVMMLVARPLSVLAATWSSNLSWRERVLLACMAPRGIVAAAVSSVFALSLTEVGQPRAVEMVPVTFLLVFVTVLVYGLSAAPLARWLGLIQANPQGILFVGADTWVRALARTLQAAECPVFLVDTDWENVRRARMDGLPCLFGSALAEQTREDIDYSGLGRMLAVTSNNEVNSLCCLRYAEDFGRQEVFQLPFSAAKAGRHEVVPLEHRGRLLFEEDLTFERITDIAGPEPKFKLTRLTAEFNYGSFQVQHGESVIPLFVLRPGGMLQIRTVQGLPEPQPDDAVIGIVRDGS